MKTTGIICVYNEEETIKEVINVVTDCFFDEVIVVNDGSDDKTDKIVRELNNLHNLKYISLPKNMGKGYAMAIGIENAKGEMITFIDADLSNLTEEHFSQLLTPIFLGEADMVLGQANETLINYSINPFKSFTGERSVLRKDILPIVEKMKYSRFGVETLINLYYQSEGKKVKYVMLDGLKHPTKFDKTTKPEAVKEFVKEGHQIAVTTFKNFNLVTRSIKNKILNK